MWQSAREALRRSICVSVDRTAAGRCLPLHTEAPTRRANRALSSHVHMHLCPPAPTPVPGLIHPSHMALILSCRDVVRQTSRGWITALDPWESHGALCSDVEPPSLTNLCHMYTDHDPGLQALSMLGSQVCSWSPGDTHSHCPLRVLTLNPHCQVQVSGGTSLHTLVSVKVMKSFHFIPCGR